MKQSMQREWMSNILEASPAIVFTLLWRSAFDLQSAGWIAACLAATQLVAFRHFRLRHDPIMLGINIHLLLITPFIMGSYWAGLRGLGDVLSVHSYHGVLVTVFVVGVLLTCFSKRRFIGIDLPQSNWIKQSLFLLAATGIAIVWSFANSGDALLSVVLPLIVLFGLRRLLVARAYDRNGTATSIGLVSIGYSAQKVGGDHSAL